jgi:NAD+ kinase
VSWPGLPCLQTTDWFASIQRCFQWSERVEQQPFNAQQLLAQMPTAAASVGSLASVSSMLSSNGGVSGGSADMEA